MIGTHATLVYVDREAPVGEALDLSCLVDEVSIVHGRSDTSSQPEPSAATLDVTVGPGAPLPPGVDIGAWLVVETTVGGVTSRRFTGRVTDVSIGWDDAGANTPEAGVGQIVAVSVLADYARRVIGDEPFPQELDGARVARVFALAGLDLDPITSDPGVVEVVPRDVDRRAALEVAHDTASSAGGLVWQTRDGDVRYADAEHRRGADVTLDLDACDILVSPTWSRNLSGLVNEISVEYGYDPADDNDPATEEPPSTKATYSTDNPGSVEAFGRYAYSVTTELATLLDAQAAAWLILSQNGAPTWQLNALPVDVVGLPLDATHALLDLDVHGLVRVTGLPETGATPTSVASWVEGWAERLAWGVHEFNLTISDYCRTSPGDRWNDVDVAVTWDTYGSRTWDQAACSGGPLPNLGRWDDVPASTRWDMLDPALAWDEVPA